MEVLDKLGEGRRREEEGGGSETCALDYWGLYVIPREPLRPLSNTQSLWTWLRVKLQVAVRQ